MDTPTPSKWKYLGPKRGSMYRQLFVNGRIAARTLYGCYMSEEEPRTPEQIAADWDVPLEAVHEAIAYCQSNPPEIQQDWEEEEALINDRILNDPTYYFPGIEEKRAELLAEQKAGKACGVAKQPDTVLRDQAESTNISSMDKPSQANWKYLGPKSGSAYKQLFIKGTRIMARVIGATYHDDENPRTPEEIAGDFNVPVEAVREAIAYCDSKPPEMEEDWEREEEHIRQRILTDPNYYFPGVEKIRAQLIAERDAAQARSR